MQQEPISDPVRPMPFRARDTAFPPGLSMELLPPIRLRPGVYALPDSSQMRYARNALEHGPSAFLRFKGPCSQLKEAQLACRFVQPSFAAEDRSSPDRKAVRFLQEQIVTDVRSEFAKLRYRERNRFTRLGAEPLVVMDSKARGIVGVDSPEKLPTRQSMFLREQEGGASPWAKMVLPPVEQQQQRPELLRSAVSSAASFSTAAAPVSAADQFSAAVAGFCPSPARAGHGGVQQLGHSASDSELLLFSRRLDVNMAKNQRLSEGRRMRQLASVRGRRAFQTAAVVRQDIASFETLNRLSEEEPAGAGVQHPDAGGTMVPAVPAAAGPSSGHGGGGPPPQHDHGGLPGGDFGPPTLPQFFKRAELSELRYGGQVGADDLAGAMVFR